MRAVLIAVLTVALPFAALAEEGPVAPEEAAPAEEPAAAADAADEGEIVPVVINGDATLVINGDVLVSASANELAVRLAGEPIPQQGRATRDLGRPVKILAVYPGEVKLDIGSDDGIKAGDRFSVFRTSTVETEGDEQFEGEELVAVLTVVAVTGKYAVAELWKGDRVYETDEVLPASADDEPSHVYPRRLSHVGEVALVLRPLLAVGSTGGFGGLADLTAAYWGNHMFFDLRMQPLGFGWTENGNIVSASFMAEGGYDGRAFALGVGVGVGTTNGDIDEMLVDTMASRAGAYDEDGNWVEPEPDPWSQRTRAAFAISQQVRLGARDGLHLTVYNLLMYAKDDSSDGEDDSGFIYAGTAGKVVVPLASRTFLFGEGGGGVMGYGFGNIGVFTWVRGAGDAGSVGISALAGGAGIWGVRKKTYDEGTPQEYTVTEQVTIAGPMVGVGLTYRFGF
ncbi:MAG: hypothetical protein JRI55_07155 [Deltaproteobacteria bacterium]|jgi:hypothetical protein|nr:hypothetical protein [Deltaproteobacteria bacterium]